MYVNIVQVGVLSAKVEKYKTYIKTYIKNQCFVHFYTAAQFATSKSMAENSYFKASPKHFTKIRKIRMFFKNSFLQYFLIFNHDNQFDIYNPFYLYSEVSFMSFLLGKRLPSKADINFHQHSCVYIIKLGTRSTTYVYEHFPLVF